MGSCIPPCGPEHYGALLSHSPRREFEDGRALELLARAQDGGREVQLVGGVGEVLRFQAEAVMIAVDLAALPWMPFMPLAV